MIEKDIQNAIASFCENDYWKKVYEEAPKNAKKYLELTFYSSILAEDDKEEEDGYENIYKDVQSKMTREDWEYLIKITPSQQAKAEYRKKIEALSK